MMIKMVGNVIGLTGQGRKARVQRGLLPKSSTTSKRWVSHRHKPQDSPTSSLTLDRQSCSVRHLTLEPGTLRSEEAPKGWVQVLRACLGFSDSGWLVSHRIWEGPEPQTTL